MREPDESGTLKVPHARLYFEARGRGPLLLLIPGGPMDAGGFAVLASFLADSFTCVAYDPRGNSRSTFDEQPVRQDMDVHADDAAALIDRFGGPALVFGSSGGAQIGLNLAARYPERVKLLVAHEPPCGKLLPDAQAIDDGYAHVVATFRRDGAPAAFGAFLETTGMPEPPHPTTPPPPHVLAAFGRVMANTPYFVEHGIGPISSFVPDVATLRAGPTRVVVGVGATSQGQLANRTAVALAERLGTPPVEFPGGHVGYNDDATADAFATVLQKVL